MHKTTSHNAGMISRLLLIALLFAAVSSAQDPGTWPRRITKPSGAIVLYQPQIDDWQNYQQVDARMAFTVTPTGGKAQVGVVTVQLHSTVNMDDHTVFLSNPQITSVSFPSLDPTAATQMEQLVKTFLNPEATMTISLDRLVASVKKTKTPPVTNVKNDPPTIFMSIRPAILLQLNGEPVMAPIANSNLQFVVNANWPVFIEQGSSTYYLFDGKGWLTGDRPARHVDADEPVTQADAAGFAKPEFRKSEGFHPAASGKLIQFANGALQRYARGNHRLQRPAAVDADSRHTTVLCLQYRQHSL